MIKLRFDRRMPDIESYNNLVENIYETKREKWIISEAFKNSLDFICAYSEETGELLGFSRIIGDKTLFLYLHDVMVKKEYQGQGIGGKIVEFSLEIIREYKEFNPNVRVYLGAAKDKEGFYEKYGFLKRPNEFVGAGMILRPDFI